MTPKQAKTLIEIVTYGYAKSRTPFLVYVALEKQGYLNLSGKDIVITEQGKKFANANHLKY